MFATDAVLFLKQIVLSFDTIIANDMGLYNCLSTREKHTFYTKNSDLKTTPNSFFAH